MSNIDKISKEALREVAEDAQKAHKWEGLENGLKADGYVSTTVRFIQRASPQTVLALLDELEAKDKQIADLKEAFSIALSAAGIDVPAAASKGDAS
ncbi:MAG: ead/Ea22-like family protein [Enterobacter cloacae]|nr:ead/Ea22-like family protein [Enterobacter cloacae]